MTEPRFTAIEIQAFRGMAGVRLDGLSRVNLIVGRNNAGKTSVLEAVAACCHPVNGSAWLDMVRRRGLGSPRQPLDEQFSWLFPRSSSGSLPGDLHLFYERSGVPSRWHIHGRLSQRQEIAEEGASDGASGLESATRTVTKVELVLEPVGAPPDSPLRARCELALRAGATVPEVPSREDVPSLSVTPITHRAEMFQITAMASLDHPDVRASVVSLLQRLDPDIESLEVYDPTGGKSSIRVWHKRMGATPINAFGDGFRRTLTYALSLVRCRGGGVLLIDEIETAIHYSALRDVYRWLVEAAEEHAVQLFVTTHSLEAIDALLDATPERPDTVFFRLFDVGRGTQVMRLAEAELRTLREEQGDEVRG